MCVVRLQNLQKFINIWKWAIKVKKININISSLGCDIIRNWKQAPKKTVHGLYLFFFLLERKSFTNLTLLLSQKLQRNQSSKKSPPSKVTFIPPTIPSILLFSFRLHYPSHHYKNLGHIFHTPPTKSHLVEVSGWWK